MKTPFILNDPPYGSERSYNALRLARALGKQAGQAVSVFLMGDADVVDGARRSTLNELAEWTAAADKVLVF